MNIFEKHIATHLAGPAKPLHEWHKRNIRNARVKAARYAKRHAITLEAAKEALMFQSELDAQGPYDEDILSR